MYELAVVPLSTMNENLTPSAAHFKENHVYHTFMFWQCIRNPFTDIDRFTYG